MVTPADQRLSDMATALHAELARQPMDSPDFIALAKAADAADSLTGRSVWLVTIEDRYGHATSVYSTEPKAVAFAADYCRERWNNSGPDTDQPEDDQELIDAFNEENERDSEYNMVIESCQIDS